MKLLIGFLLPLIIIALPLLGQLYLGNKTKKKGKFALAVILGIITTCLGLITPILALLISIKGLTWNDYSWYNDRVRCVSGAATFLFLGYLATIATVILAIVNGVRIFKRQRPVVI